MTQIICFPDIFWPRKPSRKNFLAKINEMRSNSVLTCGLKGFKYSKLQLIFGKLHCKNDFQFHLNLWLLVFKKADVCIFYVKSWFKFHLFICNSFTKFYDQKISLNRKESCKKAKFREIDFTIFFRCLHFDEFSNVIQDFACSNGIKTLITFITILIKTNE